MGMFDNIKVDMDLPEWPEELKIKSFQTKSTPSQAMVNYRIGVHGNLYQENCEYKWVDDTSIVGGHFDTTESEWVFCSHISQVITFYLYWNHPDYTYDQGFYFESGCIEYSAKIVKGRVTSIECIEKKLPVKLSDEEVEIKRAEYEKNAKVTRERMIESRKLHPTHSQKLADDIASLIENKFAISDQSDYIKIINGIEKLISEWRDKHDPWYEKEKV
jgi:hypothetical protein